MASEIGGSLIESSVVFGYDTGYGVADNHTATRFYPGEPTTNYVTQSILENGWSGSSSSIDSDTNSFQFNVSNFNGSPGAGWRSFMWDMRAHTGSAVTISATIEIPDNSPGDWAWVMIGQANSRSDGTTTATYLGYSTASERYQKTTKNTERISWSGTIGNTGTANQPNGIIGFTVWYNNGTTNTNSFIKVSNVQIEKKSHATPFVNGTRSNTAGLIDLARASNIDTSSMSFDSTGQLQFDGTDDKITLPANSYAKIGINDFTFEAIVKNTKTSSYNHFFSIKDQYHFAIKLQNTSTRNMYVYRDSSLSTFSAITAQLPSTTDYYYIACKRQGDDLELFINGESKGTKSGWGEILIQNDSYATVIGNHVGEYNGGFIPVMKLHGLSLSDDEIKENYKSYKNRFNL